MNSIEKSDSIQLRSGLHFRFPRILPCHDFNGRPPPPTVQAHCFSSASGASCGLQPAAIFSIQNHEFTFHS